MMNKTQQTASDVKPFLAAIPDPQRRADAHALCALLTRIIGAPPRMWGASIVGFGRYRYCYDSGREGEMARISFSPRKDRTVLYLADGFPEHADLLARLGPHKTGKSCLYLKRLADIDIAVLEQLVAASLAAMAIRYPPA